MIESCDTVLLQSDGKPCCKAFMIKACNVSRNFIYATRLGGERQSNMNRSRSDVTIMSWFEELLPIVDKMPDTDW